MLPSEVGSLTILVKIHRKGQMTLPSSFRAAMGVGEGSMVELSLKNGKTLMNPKRCDQFFAVPLR